MGTVAGIHDDIVEEHFGHATSLFAQRRAVVRSRAVRLAQLAELDARLRAHLDGLVAAGDVGRSVVGTGESRGTSRAFVLTVAAGYRRDRDELEQVVTELRDDEYEPALVSALGWLAPQFVAPMLEDWAGYHAPRWRALALAGHVAHRLEPRGAVVRAIQFDDAPSVKREAVRACGVLGFRSLAPALRRLYDGGSGSLRFLVARALLQLGEPDAPSLLWECACEGREYSETAAELAARHVSSRDVKRWIARVAALTRLSRVALAAAAATGSPAFANVLLDALDDPDLAALAAYGLHCMFGLDLAAKGMEVRRLSAPDPELPFPNATRVRQWWVAARGRFDESGRSLLGRPLEIHSMRYALWHGPQRLRALAAHDLHRLLGGDRVPFEIDAPAWRQRRRLAAAMRLRSTSA